MSSARSRSGGKRRRTTLSRCSRSSRNSPCRTRSSRFWCVAAMMRTFAAQRRVAADAVVLAVREHAQQPHLQVGGHVADLVEEQRAAFGLLEAAAAHRSARR